MIFQYVICDRCSHKSYNGDARFNGAFNLTTIQTVAGTIVNDVVSMADVPSRQKIALCQTCQTDWLAVLAKFLKEKVG